MRLWALGVLMMLAGCGRDEQPSAAAAQLDETPQGPFVIPASIEELMAMEFPADGQIHVIRAVGRFDIQPETAVCRSRQPDDDESRFNGLAGPELFDALGQSGPSRMGGDRIRRPDDARCHEPTAVLIHGIKSDNRNGQPYKLVLAIWQGDTMWIAGIERVEGGPRPRIFNPYGTNPLPIELTTDIQALSAYFIENGL